jgi:hypothetical protein
MTEEVGAFLRYEVIKEFADTVPEGVDGALGGFAKQSLEL